MASDRSVRRLAAIAGILGALALPSVSEAAIPSIPNGAGGDIACTVQTGANAGERWCSGIFTTFDGAPIDINVGFPPAPAFGTDGNFPIVGVFHGWGGSKLGQNTGSWIDNGYAFFSMSDRGWGNSCGGTDPKRLQPVCQQGYNHLMDTRYEVRDAQELFEALADRLAIGSLTGEGLIDPQKIAVTGGSYGGGISMALGALKDRKMVPANDGTLIPWLSDGGKSMRIAAAQPDIPWTDLAYSLQPNGHTLDYVKDSPYLQRGRIGVMKQSWVALLYASGQALSNYAVPGTDPDADLIQWYASINAGEPYDQNPLSSDIVNEITKHHSSYYIDHSEAPAPMLISNGFTDDLFPPDEAIRFYNRTRSEHPGTPIALMFTDHGHARGQNKVPDGVFRSRQLHNWFDYYVKGVGPAPYQGVQTLTQTCGGPSGGATGPFDDPDTDQPFRASRWSKLAPGEVHFNQAAAQTISPAAADTNGATFDPNGGGGACATAPSADQPGTASYRLDPAPAGGYTLMGSPTIVADINSLGPTSQVAARLLDVDPVSGDESLVARGLYRPEINPDTTPTRQVFQLHPNGWKFEQDHVAKLELLPADQPYGRNSNGQLPVTVSNLELRLPVLEQPGAGPVEAPAPKVVPPGYELSRDYLAQYPRPASATPLRVPLVLEYAQCTTPNTTHVAPLALPSCSPPSEQSSLLTTSNSGKGSGFARLRAIVGNPGTPADEADLAIRASMTDVRSTSGGGDYTGQVILNTRVRMTDSSNGGTEDPGTVRDADVSVPVDCTGTPAPNLGSRCNVDTTLDTLVPGFVKENALTIMSTFSLNVKDPGPDGDIDPSSDPLGLGCPPTCGTGDESVFLRQGVFTP